MIRDSLVITAAGADPVTLDEIKLYARIDISEDDALLTSLITAAREYAEAEIGDGRLLCTAATCRWSLDRFPLLPNSQYAPGNPAAVTPVVNNVWPWDPATFALIVPRAPLIGVTSVKYYDANGVLQTMDPAGYVTDLDGEPGRITPSAGGYWPNAQERTGAVQVTFTAGYATAAAVPERAKVLIKMLAAYWYDNRNAAGARLEEQPMAVRAIAASLKTGQLY